VLSIRILSKFIKNDEWVIFLNMASEQQHQSSKTHILVAGLYYSGSSAVIDLLREFNNIAIYPGEFVQFRGAGLIGDIIDFGSGKYSQDRTKSYISKKGGMDYLIGSQELLKSGRRQKLQNLIDSIINRFIRAKATKTEFSDNALLAMKSLTNELNKTTSLAAKIQSTKNWLVELDNIYARDTDYVVYDQAIYLGKHREIWPQIFAPFKLVVVIRNPLDQLAQLIKLKKISNDHDRCTTNGIGEIYGNDLSGYLRYHADALKARFENLTNLSNQLPANSFLIINFEDLVLNYNTYRKILIDFITGSKNNIHHHSPRRYFIPEKSKCNVDLHLMLPEILNNKNLFFECLEHYNKFTDASRANVECILEKLNQASPRDFHEEK
jgi:hypothetical protein